MGGQGGGGKPDFAQGGAPSDENCEAGLAAIKAISYTHLDGYKRQGQKGELSFNQTPFYGESGGQVGDSGTITFENGAIFEVSDTQKRAGGLFCHIGELKSGEIAIGNSATLKIDTARRNDIRANHSATHLLHLSLIHI